MSEQLKLHGFKNLTLIAHGPYYSLYEGIRIQTDVRYWVQVLDAELEGNSTIAAAFENLPKLSPNLKHPHILTPITFEKIDDHPILLYESFTGKSLQSLLKAETPFVERNVTTIIIATVKALQIAQLHGIKHGWLSSDFVFWSKFDDSVKILGFGSQTIFEEMVKINAASAGLSIQKIPPENISQDRQIEFSDTYALGCFYYELLAGSPPFKKIDPDESKKEKREYIPDPHALNPKLSEQASRIAMSLIDPDVENRMNYSSVLDKLDFRIDVDEETAAPEPQFKLSLRQKIRIAMINARQGGLVGSKKRVVYTIIIALVFLVSVSGMFIVSGMFTRDEKHLEKVYADFVAEASRETSGPADNYYDAVPSIEDVSNSDNSSAFVERNSAQSTSVAEEHRISEEIPETIVESKPEVTPPLVEYADIRIQLVGDNQPESARVMINERFFGLLNRAQPLYLQEFDVERSYRVRVTAADYKSWEKRIRLSSLEENNVNVTMEPLVAAKVLHFQEVDFADKIRIDGAVVKNLPCSIEMNNGVHRATYIDSKSNFSWSTDVRVDGSTPETFYVAAETVGYGEASIVLQNPIQYGYVFVRINESIEKHATPFKVRLPVGRHRVRLSRQDYHLSPADTMIFIRPFESTQIRCKVLN